MITDAIINLKDRNGSSRPQLKKYVKANNKLGEVTDSMFDSLFNRALKAGVDKGVFEQPKGPSGGTKLAKKAPPKKEAAPKKVAKKDDAKAAPKKAAAPKEKKEKDAAEKPAAPRRRLPRSPLPPRRTPLPRRRRSPRRRSPPQTRHSARPRLDVFLRLLLQPSQQQPRRPHRRRQRPRRRPPPRRLKRPRHPPHKGTLTNFFVTSYFFFICLFTLAFRAFLMGKFFWEVRRKAIWGSVSGIFISVLCFCVHRRAVMLWALFFFPCLLS
ncbi:hypothetical protein MCOR02_008395 [Pyricularia oryzae]|nr:hypothetical protein MCOR02_008395 [Pyricularia oryzae]